VRAAALPPGEPARLCGLLHTGVVEADLVELLTATRPGCRLWPEQTRGPYHRDVQPERRDITEGRPGVPLRSESVPREVVAPGETFLRGRRYTDDRGMCAFTTIYPGWYTSRTRAHPPHGASRRAHGDHSALLSRRGHRRGLRPCALPRPAAAGHHEHHRQHLRRRRRADHPAPGGRHGNGLHRGPVHDHRGGAVTRRGWRPGRNAD